jgi:hypothetical protein
MPRHLPNIDEVCLEAQDYNILLYWRLSCALQLLGRWMILKQNKDMQQMNCPTVDLKATDNDTVIEATFSTVDIR